MKKERITQEHLVFYKLYRSFKDDPLRWVSAWEFVGEIFIEELKQWILMSYKTPANGVAIYFKNPSLVERRKTTGKSGAKYYQYRLAPNPSIDKIIDISLKEFYIKIRS